jgi:hypothetical protein
LILNCVKIRFILIFKFNDVFEFDFEAYVYIKQCICINFVLEFVMKVNIEALVLNVQSFRM